MKARVRFDARREQCRTRGVMLLGLLLMLMLAAIAAMAAAEVWATTRQREREQELLFVGDQYRRAIRHYYYASPRGQARVLPAKLEDLLADNRFPQPVQHLRRLYPDPITDGAEWGLLMRGDRIAGVYSMSQAQPLKQTGFDGPNAGFETKSSYRDWVFLFLPPRATRN
ncbi:type II secretion system protein [Piscinibacter sp.]|uniref:type II secretion system protein n=1 Tax=Piscinibacter sp. TaxID=1903157 RepID=UPI00355A26C3